MCQEISPQYCQMLSTQKWTKFRDLWEATKFTNICKMRASGKEEEEKEQEQIIAKNVSNDRKR